MSPSNISVQSKSEGKMPDNVMVYRNTISYVTPLPVSVICTLTPVTLALV
jgi:hypothetical protein